MKKILIVDDSRTALMMNEMILKRYPFEIASATSGEEALARIADEHPDRKVPVHDDYLAETYYAGVNGPPHQLLGDHELVALVPLRLTATTTGALAIFSLLPHKSSLEQLDLDLLALLTHHAPIALHLAQLCRSPDPEGSAC